MVYIAFGVFAIGTVYRLITIFSQPKNPSTLRIYPDKGAPWLLAAADALLFPTIRRHKPVLWVFLMIFHICLVLLLITHLELIAEWPAFQFIAHEIPMGHGFVGLLLAVCLIYFLFRRFKSPVKELSIPEDYLMLILLFLTILFGAEMNWARTWYEYGEMGVGDYREYLYGLVTFSPELPDVTRFSGHSFMLVVHVFFANVLLMLFPFSQMMHAFLSLPINKLRRG
jgi:nitrate reductase gamma subunit